MKFHKEGYASLVLVLLFSAIIIFIAHYFFPAFAIAHWFAYLLSAFLTITIVQFFRNPTREPKKGDNLIIAPADGKVVVIEETTDPEYFKTKRLQVSIFMSPANVHVNRNPISGLVVYNQYHKGKYLVAWHPKSSTENERHSVVIRKGETEILVKQIAGALAKRIMNYLEVGQQVNQTDEMGFIKFGSRVDLLLPVGTKINVELNQVVQGGVTVIATL